MMWMYKSWYFTKTNMINNTKTKRSKTICIYSGKYCITMGQMVWGCFRHGSNMIRSQERQYGLNWITTDGHRLKGRHGSSIFLSNIPVIWLEILQFCKKYIWIACRYQDLCEFIQCIWQFISRSSSESHIFILRECNMLWTELTF